MQIDRNFVCSCGLCLCRSRDTGYHRHCDLSYGLFWDFIFYSCTVYIQEIAICKDNNIQLSLERFKGSNQKFPDQGTNHHFLEQICMGKYITYILAQLSNYVSSDDFCHGTLPYDMAVKASKIRSHSSFRMHASSTTHIIMLLLVCCCKGTNSNWHHYIIICSKCAIMIKLIWIDTYLNVLTYNHASLLICVCCVLQVCFVSLEISSSSNGDSDIYWKWCCYILYC